MSAPIVSEEEMTSLLGAPAAATPGLTPVTLGAPSPLSKEEERRFSAAFRESARAVGASLGAMIRKEI
ncbi:MAG TPA: hypothetical protein VE404_08190, partial [Verrucomicrobiae bacterium]|nr:hypothetical protein [Verrucomicrobiae bacterium]